jgi:3-dehydroquinate synthase
MENLSTIDSSSNNNNNNNLHYSTTSTSNTTITFIKSEADVTKFSFINKYSISSKILILTEEKIFSKYSTYINTLLRNFTSNINYFTYYIHEGDFFKNDEIVNKVFSFMLERSFDRSSCIIGFGGGKITDLAGYIASVYQRGIDNILIPTNLLSMVDASIGGKTGINHLKYGKNLIGTVYQPKHIIINLWILDELNEELISEGMSEMIKMFSMFDAEAFFLLFYK